MPEHPRLSFPVKSCNLDQFVALCVLCLFASHNSIGAFHEELFFFCLFVCLFFFLVTEIGLSRLSKARPHYAGGIWKRRFHSENASNVFRPHYAGEIWKRNNHRRQKRLSETVSMRRSNKINMAITISDLCLRKTRADKSPDYRDVIVFEKLRFQNVFSPH